jgi:hypothetical protein
MNIEPPYYLMILGGLITIPGLVVFANIIRTHPRITRGETDGGC